MIWVVLAFIFSNAFTGLYCYLRGLARAMSNKNGTEEDKKDDKDND